MLRLDRGQFSNSFIYKIWLLMAFQAGYVNVGGFFLSGSFVSHVTGTSSNIGIGLAKLDIIFIVTFVVILSSFIAGAAFTGNHIENRKKRGKKPRYIYVLGVKSFFFGLVLLLSEMDLLLTVAFSEDVVNLLIVFLLSFCCGIQNATCSLASKGFLKPTHMTGLSTDVGLGLAQMFSGTRHSMDKETREKTYLRLSILGSFIVGGSFSTIIFTYNGHYGFLFPFLSSLCFWAITVVMEKKLAFQRSPYFKLAKGSMVATFVATILFGIHAFIQL